MGLKKFTVPLTDSDFLDVKLKVEKNIVVDFSLNYRAKICESFFEIYRVDTAHGFLHEQRFWITPEPIPVPSMERNLNYIFNFYLNQIKENFKRYKSYFEDRMKMR
ncbi:hypothetical protein KKG83_01100 [Candidatus Micrarchaeota archaeon]|nr:hypothetical protein [Candidatus Micrarchaeota archaeon]MBU2476046.1 hypothetical protein [Candidatus Micrarchaeota archaeon]